MKVNFTGQLFDMLANKTPENITNLRFIPSDIFESSKVRITHYYGYYDIAFMTLILYIN
jgi:hypothetical protein